MVWGLIMEPKRRYTQVVKLRFHISMAALDIFSADDNPTQLMLYFEESNYLLCTLQKGHTVQCPLDLNFAAGDEIAFLTNGNCNIHLSGYLEKQLDLDNDLKDEEEEEEVEENEQAKAVKVSRKKSSFSDFQKPSSKKFKLEAILKENFDSNDEDDESFVVSEGADEEDEIEEEDDVQDEEEEDESDDEEEENTTKSNLQAKNEEKSTKLNVQAMNGKKPKSLKKQNNKKKNEKFKKDAAPVKQNDQKNVSPQQKRTVEGGVVVQDLRIGEGAIAKSGKVVQVYYEGRLKQNNKLFDQSTKGSGFKFRLGKQEVIKGWDVGVVGMKVGGHRRITCPASMAYGQKGLPPAIPPNASLVFDVELKNVT